MVGGILNILSAGILGIFLGAQICEAVLFVPYWKTLNARDFFELHKTYGKKIYQFFAPLTIAATIIPVIAAAYALTNRVHGSIFSLSMGVLTLMFFSTYYIYFKQANRSFADASISDEELPKELDRWGRWHWGRTGLEFVAFVFSLLALAQI